MAVKNAHGLVPRHAEHAVSAALADTRVVLINGVRQAGKSTLARTIVATRPDAKIQLLDVAEVRNAANADPSGFVQHEGLLVLDEVQRVPELLLAIKAVVDEDSRPGQYLLTGSSRLLGRRDIPDALPGRMETITLWPFTQGELDGQPDRFIDAVFTHGPELSVTSELKRQDYAERVARGGYPEAIKRNESARRRRFFADYLNDLIDREVRELSDIEYAARVRQLMRMLAARTASPLILSPLASDLGVTQPTVRHYVDLLEQVYLTRRIPAWSRNLTARATATPKVVVADSGLATHLVGQSPDRLAEPDGALGPLLEAFVAMELIKQLSWSDEMVDVYHFRTRDQVEVDLILESAAGDVIGIEVKSTVTARSEDFRGLRYLSDRIGSRFLCGILLHAGTQTLPFGPKLRAMPVSAVWTAEP